jgi:hypothetical protein
MKNYLALFALLFVVGFGSCQTTPQQKLEKAKGKLALATQAIDSKSNEIEDKGKTLVYGANYANRLETNRTPAVNTSSRLLDLAQLSLGNPSVKDASNIKEIVDGLLFEAKLSESLLNTKLAASESDASYFKKQSETYKKKVGEAEEKLTKLTTGIANLQSEKTELEKVFKEKQAAVEKVNTENATKAAKWDEENTFFNSINPFHDLLKLVKKLAVLGGIVGILVAGFRIAELFFPGLNIVGSILGFFGRWIFKFAPKAKKAAGVVSGVIWDAFKVNVKAIDSFFQTLARGEIESHILEAIPDDAKLTKNDLAKYFSLYGEKIEEGIKIELDKFHNEESRGVVNLAKTELGLKQVKNIDNLV